MSLTNAERNEQGWIFHNHAWHLLHEIIREIATMENVETILDYGAGCGIAAACIKAVFPEKEIYACDIDPEYETAWDVRGLAGQVFDAVESDTWDIPVYYDLIICSHVLEHIDNPAEYIKVFSKLAKNLILVVPDGPAQDPSHKHVFDRVSFLDTINSAIEYRSIKYYPVYHPHINNLMAVINL